MTNERLKLRPSLQSIGVFTEKTVKKTVLVEMASFREARLMLLDSYDDGLIDEDELLCCTI